MPQSEMHDKRLIPAVCASLLADRQAGHRHPKDPQYIFTPQEMLERSVMDTGKRIMQRLMQQLFVASYDIHDETDEVTNTCS